MTKARQNQSPSKKTFMIEKIKEIINFAN